MLVMHAKKKSPAGEKKVEVAKKGEGRWEKGGGGKRGEAEGKRAGFLPLSCSSLSLSPDSNQELPHFGGWVAVAVEGGGGQGYT